MKEKNYFAEEELDIKKIIIIFWKEKFLIFSIIFLCTISTYLYINTQEVNKNEFKKNRYEFTLNNVPGSTLIHYESRDIRATYLLNKAKNNLSLYLSSSNNFLSFIEQTNDLDYLKASLKSRQSIELYYIKNFGKVLDSKNIISEDKYFLNLPEKISGEKVVINYLNFTKKKVLDAIKKDLKHILEAHLANHQDLYDKAKNLNYNDPFFFTQSYNNSAINPPGVFYGTKYFASEINSLKLLISKLENDNLDYDIISNIYFYPISLKPTLSVTTIYFLAAFVFGLFLSLIVIVFKNILKYR